MNEMIEDPRLGLSLCTPVNHSTSNMYTHTQPGLVTNPAAAASAASFYMNRARGTSTSSLASSVASDSYNYSLSATAAAGYTDQLSDAFAALIMRVYQELCSDPTVTPFDTLQPPAGILERTAKLAVQRAAAAALDTGLPPSPQANPALLQALARHRLTQELRREGYLSRNGSASSLQQAPAPPQFAELLHSTHNSAADPLDPTWFRAAVPLSATLSSAQQDTRLLQPQPHLGRVSPLPTPLAQLQPGFGLGQPQGSCGRECAASPQFGQGLAQQRGYASGNTLPLGVPLGLPLGLGRTASPLATTPALTAANMSRHEQTLALDAQGAAARRTRDVLAYRRGV